jgi:cytochrome b subunit of formate dehydrogenase
MTGYSHNKVYIKKLVSGLLIVGGSFLLLEHLFNFGGFDIELIGHEYYGIGMIIAAFLLSLKWKQLPALLEAIRNREWLKVLDEGERGQK